MTGWNTVNTPWVELGNMPLLLGIIRAEARQNAALVSAFDQSTLSYGVLTKTIVIGGSWLQLLAFATALNLPWL